MKWLSSEDSRKALTVLAGSAGQLTFNVLAALLTTAFLPVRDRGIYVITITTVAILAPIAVLGANVGLRRNLPRSEDGARLERRYLRLTAAGASAVALLSPVVVAATSSGLLRLDQLLPVVAIGLAQALSWHFVELWYARGRFGTASRMAAAHAFGSLLAAGSAAVSNSLTTVLWVQAVSTLAMQLVQAWWLIRTLPAIQDSSGTQRTAATGSLISSGLPGLVLTVGMSLAFRLDRLLLGTLSGAEAVAIYSLAASFAELPRFLPNAWGQVANSRAAQTAHRMSLSPYLLPAFALAAFGAVAAGGLGVVVASELLDPIYSKAIPLLALLLLAELLLVPYSVVSRMILGGGRVKLSAAVGSAAIAVAVPLYWFSISHFGAAGAAWASVTVYGFVSALCVGIHFSQRPDPAGVTPGRTPGDRPEVQ